jgi:glycosyltransferase involved in cell wall biosynthesis
MGGVFNAVFLWLAVLIPVARAKRERPFDVIDAHFGHPEGIAAALLSLVFRRPFVVTLRGSEVEHARERLRRIGLRWALRRAARVIAVSENLRQFAIGLGVDPRCALTIPNGVDSGTFCPRDREVCRERNGIAQDRKVILCAGHLIELKGHHHVVRALRQLLDWGIDVELVIAGGRGKRASFAEEIRQEIHKLDLDSRTRMAGEVKPEKLAELMCAADVFCLASSREGWPNVVHEALSCGTPVVATRVGAIPEMLPSEEYGLAWPVEDVGRLAIPVRQALEKNWDRASIAAWGSARGWDQTAAEVVRQLEAAAGR